MLGWLFPKRRHSFCCDPPCSRIDWRAGKRAFQGQCVEGLGVAIATVSSVMCAESSHLSVFKGASEECVAGQSSVFL